MNYNALGYDHSLVAIHIFDHRTCIHNPYKFYIGVREFIALTIELRALSGPEGI
jgi:hypothetical protein